MLRRILPLCIFCLSVLALASQVEKGAEIDMISHDGESYPRVFVPTEEFQVIKEGQEIPAGLHVRINLQTGEKEAKFNDPGEGDDRSHKIDLKDIQIIDDPESRERKKKLVQTYAAPSGPSPSNDHEIFLDALRSLTDTTASTNSLESSLSNLELLSHDLEYGIKLVHPEILSTLLQFLQTHQDATIRQSSARIIGSSLLNNPESHYLVSGQGLLEKFVAIIEKEEDNGVRASVIFALSAATASEEDMREVMQAEGSEILRRVYEKGDSDVRGKCATFVEDKLLLHRSITGVDSELSQWCHILQRSLLSKIEKEEPLTSQKLLSSLIAMKKEARALCQTEPDFLTWLADRVVSPGGVDDGVRGLVKEARHLFGNPNAARKTAWEDEPKHVKDEL